MRCFDHCKTTVFPYCLVGEGSTASSTPDFCTGTFIKKVKLPSSCTFEHGACGYTAPKTGLMWAIRTGKYGYGSLGITAAHGGSGECNMKWTTGVELFYDLLLVMITCCIVYVNVDDPRIIITGSIHLLVDSKYPMVHSSFSAQAQ